MKTGIGIKKKRRTRTSEPNFIRDAQYSTFFLKKLCVCVGSGRGGGNREI